jgi:Zinc carboxypeptidase/Immune inhibitor A peptidase M6
MYEATVSQEQYRELVSGYDVVAPRQTPEGVAVDLVLSDTQRALLSSKGIELELMRDAQGRTVQERAAAQAAGGFEVYREYDGPDGLEKFIRRFAKRNEKIAKLKVIGQSVQGRDILAVRLTDENDEGTKKGSHKREAPVLYQGTTHAREWISTEMTVRLMRWFGSDRPKAKKLVRKRELWFVPVVNPDGYQYTFEGDRLWRKNMRLNNDDGVFNLRDGVDLNRNYPEHWNYDDEGSETNTASETYRGPSAGSEPETQADMRLVHRIPFRFTISYHSYAALLLYPEGWQVQTPSRDDPIYEALSGTDENPAIEGYDPDLSAELYTTNGEYTDWAHAIENTLGWTVEHNEGCEGCGFVFPDDEAAVQQEFEINLPFAIDVAKSAAKPTKPKSHLGAPKLEPFYLETVSLDPTRANNPLSDFRFAHSYGDPQPVEVLARRKIGKVKVHYRINGGAEQTAPTSEWNGGETYGESYDVYYHVMRGEVNGTDPGDEVEVWFEAKKKGKTRTSGSFTYTAESKSGAETLVVAAEDYTGISPGDGSGTAPSYLSYFTDALDANSISHDVYDVDARDRVAPDHLGVLSHFDSVVWYTGDDIITRDVGMVPGTASRLANDEMLEMRSYLNEGGKLLYNGQFSGLQYSANGYFFDPVENAPCFLVDENEEPVSPEVDARCQFLPDDFLQYYLGAYIYAEDTGTDPESGNPFDLEGIADPYAGETWSFNGADSAGNQAHTASFLTTSSILPDDEYPQFASDARAAWVSEAEAPYEPFHGSQYLYSQRANQSYKRLTRTVDLSDLNPGDPASLSFQISHDTEPAWDFVFVEAHTVGSEDWTTLPEVNGHTSDDTGDSCPEGWQELHPWLAHYQTDNEDGTCTSTGTSGEWNAASGRSPGWQQWEFDLSAYAGEQVEISISYVSDWGVQGIGTFLDQIEVTPTGEGNTSFEDDDDPMDGWEIPGPPEGTALNSNDWLRTGSLGFEEGAIVSTDDTLYFGFGLEGVTGAAERADLLGRSLSYMNP